MKWPKGKDRWEGKSGWWVNHRANNPPLSNQGRRTTPRPYRSLRLHAAPLAFSQKYPSVGRSNSNFLRWGLIMIDSSFSRPRTSFRSSYFGARLKLSRRTIHLWLDTPNPQQINNPLWSCELFIGYFRHSQNWWRVVDHVRVEPEFREDSTQSQSSEEGKTAILFRKDSRQARKGVLKPAEVSRAWPFQNDNYLAFFIFAAKTLWLALVMQ